MNYVVTAKISLKDVDDKADAMETVVELLEGISGGGVYVDIQSAEKEVPLSKLIDDLSDTIRSAELKGCGSALDEIRKRVEREGL